MSLPENLLADAKNYLDITWPDPDGDKKLEGILARGMADINRIAGSSQDFTAEAAPRELLFDYCRYVRDGALAQFVPDHLHRIIALQIDKAVDYD